MKTFKTINASITSGVHHSYWVDSSAPLIYKTLTADIATDVLIIGGGIAGLTTAYCLSKAGKKVVLVEDGYLGSGETGRTTAQITYALDDRYYDIERYYGTEKAKLVAHSHKNAIAFIEGVVKQHAIDCNFKLVDGYLFRHPTDMVGNMEKEFTATQNLGLPTELVSEVPGFAHDGLECIRFPQQGQFHVMKYLKGLAEAIVSLGGEIYTGAHAESITKTGATANGFTLSANHIVVATNTPVNDVVTMHTKQFAYRTYVIAAKIPKGRVPYAMWWDTGNQDSKWVAKPYHYVRLEPFDDQYDLLISGGEDHKTGMADDENIPEEDRYQALTAWTQLHFPYFKEVEYKWSGQVMEPVDCLAFIGKNPGDDNIYIITGDSGNGMTHGTIGGQLLTDIISGISNPLEEIYDPSRITIKTAGDFLKETGDMAYTAIKDWVSAGDVDNEDDLANGQGAVISSGLKKIAAYRDEQGVLHRCSAVCPHLGGVLQWNNDERSFDCPLHGSRFTTHGTCINGPAITNLKKIDD